MIGGNNINKIRNLTKPLLCYDVIFKAVFTGNENILAKMISDITGIDYNLLENNITLESNELSISKKNEKAKRCDFIVRVDKNNIINIELNRRSYTGLVVRNLSYLFNIFSTNFMKGEKYNDDLVVTQINIDAFDGTDKVLSKYSIREESDGSLYSKNIVIYSLNVVKAKKVYYNGSAKEINNPVRWGALIYNNDFTKIPEITDGIMCDNWRNIIMDKLDKIQNDDTILTQEEMYKWQEWEMNTIYNDGLEQGLEQGIEQGKEETLINTIKNMLDKNYEIEEIMDITNKSKEEILEIKNNM